MTVERRTHATHDGLVVTLNLPPNPPPVADGVPVVSLSPSTRPRDALPGRPPAAPSPDEMAKLPRTAREAFAVRVALLEAENRPDVPACLRRDFDRLVLMVRANGWTDDTPVSQEVFGPL